jgi:pimeloyl-ACP methyl ester carboxylesterase
VAYFGEPGLPTVLSAIPLEYFNMALTWLRRQSGVDPNLVWIIGGSRGTEAAQLLAVHYPALVHGIVLNAPSSVALCSYPGCGGPAWTLHGEAVPYTKQTNTTAPIDDPAAVIPVHRFHGPVLAVCGQDDPIWSACAYSNSIMKRLPSNASPHTLLQYPDAGHLGGVVAYQPGSASFATTAGTAVGTDLARSQAWPKELSFILNHTH